MSEGLRTQGDMGRGLTSTRMSEENKGHRRLMALMVNKQRTLYADGYDTVVSPDITEHIIEIDGDKVRVLQGKIVLLNPGPWDGDWMFALYI
tara:strand:- start:409 stop:684 length:276 start_codon:yes stop_codon:yes gene_type:complete